MAAATAPDLRPVSTILAAVLGGGIIVGLVALYKARSEKDLNSTQAMALLFEKQREVNVDQLKQHDLEMQRLRDELDHANGDRASLRKRLSDCQRERTALRNQITGLEATLAAINAARRAQGRGRGHSSQDE